MRRLLSLALLLVVSIGSQWSAAQSLISPEKAMRHGLKRAWFAQLGDAAASGELSHVNYDEGMLLVQSSRGLVTAIDAETGRTLWSTRIGRRKGSEPAANDKFVVVLNGSTLFVLDRQTGGTVWQRQVKGAPGSGPGVSATHAFVPMISGLIEGYDLEAGVRQTPWNYQSTGQVLLPPTTTPLTVSWTTERGFFYAADPSAAGIRYRLETRGAIHSQPTAWSPRLFACSVDGYVYALDERKGTIEWKYVVGEPMYERPAAVDNKVFAIADSTGMYCLDAEKGQLLWHAAGIHQFVALTPTRVYAEDKLGNLAILDASTGMRLDTMPTSALTQKLVNNQSDRIFLVDRAATIQCLHEPQLVSPVVYRPPAAPEKELKLVPKPKPAAPAKALQEEAPAEEMPAEGEDPAPPADADNPFAPEAGGDAPAEPPADADNPFAPTP
jgi:outer membrane protein assembly factor BamB